MAREILFKAKRIDKHEGKWVEGYVSRPHLRDTEKGILSYYFNAIDEMGWTYECIVSAETVCQYTGLTDKNGNKIWENDIVEIPTESGYFIVEWSDTEAKWQMYNKEDLFTVDFDNYWSYQVEVIGNKFDNPELLETVS